MKEAAIKLINAWKKVLKDFLDPLEVIDALPKIFGIGSPQYIKVCEKRKEPHEAVGVIIDEVIGSELDFDDFIEALRKSGHGWLAPLVSGIILESEVEKALLKQENLEYVRELLSIIGPYLKKTIHASDVAEHLYRKEIITEEEFGFIKCRVREDGNCIAVRFLLSCLVRKPPGWWLLFNKVLQDLNYSDDLTDLLQTLPTDDSIYYSSDVPEETGFHKEIGSAGATAKPTDTTPSKRISKMAANFSSPFQSATGVRQARVESRTEIEMDLREYQKVLARDAIAGKNVIICAPTGSGKTRVAAHIIYRRFNETLEKNPKVGFVVPRVALAKQQRDSIKSYLSMPKWSVEYLIGDKKSTLKDMLQSSQVIVITPQILLNALADGSVPSLKKFDMLIFDECHHAMKDSPYNVIMSHYLQLKHKGSDILPQIIGLTATLGVGKGKLDSSATDHMLKLCANLDATGGIVTVPLEHEDELNRHTPQPEEENITLDGDPADPITQCLWKTIDEIVGILYSLNIYNIKGVTRPHPLPKGDQQYIQWCQDFKAKAVSYLTSDPSLCKDVQICVDYLKIFNEALDLNIKCRAVDALLFLERNLVQPYEKNLSGTENRLNVTTRNCIQTLKNNYDDSRCINPNLKKMEGEILRTFENDPNSRAMLNVQKRQYAEPIKNWLNESKLLKELHVNAEYFTGVGKSKNGATQGLTHNKQENILEMFRRGDIKVIVCTPEVASEGLDIVDCNLVLCYDYVKNEISKTQVKGRARKEGGRMLQFSSRKVEARDKVNVSKSLLMEKTTALVQEMFKNDKERYMRAIKSFQNDTLILLRLKKNLGSEKDERKPDTFKAVCKKCGADVCDANDINILEDNMHTCIDDKFKEKYTTRVIEDGGTEEKRALYCNNCDSKWGIYSKYKRICVPLLAPDAFKFVNQRDPSAAPVTGKQWKKISITFKHVKYEAMIDKMIETNTLN